MEDENAILEETTLLIGKQVRLEEKKHGVVGASKYSRVGPIFPLIEEDDNRKE